MSTACVGCGKAIDRAHYPAACSKCIKRMSLDPNPTPGQMWQRRSPSGERVRIEGMNGDEVCFSDAGSCMSASIEHFRVHYCEPTSILPEQGSRARVR